MKSTHSSWHCLAQWSSRRLGLPCGAIARQAPLSSLSAGSADGADLMLPGRRVACRHWRGTPISVLVDLHNTPREHYTCHYSLESIPGTGAPRGFPTGHPTMVEGGGRPRACSVSCRHGTSTPRLKIGAKLSNPRLQGLRLHSSLSELIHNTGATFTSCPPGRRCSCS